MKKDRTNNQKRQILNKGTRELGYTCMLFIRQGLISFAWDDPLGWRKRWSQVFGSSLGCLFQSVYSSVSSFRDCIEYWQGCTRHHRHVPQMLSLLHQTLSRRNSGGRSQITTPGLDANLSESFGKVWKFCFWLILIHTLVIFSYSRVVWINGIRGILTGPGGERTTTLGEDIYQIFGCGEISR